MGSWVMICLVEVRALDLLRLLLVFCRTLGTSDITDSVLFSPPADWVRAFLLAAWLPDPFFDIETRDIERVFSRVLLRDGCSDASSAGAAETASAGVGSRPFSSISGGSTDGIEGTEDLVGMKYFGPLARL